MMRSDVAGIESLMTSLTAGIPGPCIIGATGGSGTRVVARIAREGGMYIGTNLNPGSFVNPRSQIVSVGTGPTSIAPTNGSPETSSRPLSQPIRRHVNTRVCTSIEYGAKGPSRREKYHGRRTTYNRKTL